MLNPRQIEAFRTVIVTGGISAAARALNISQPAVTRLIHSLQYSLGLRLFTQRGARLVPTNEALALYREVERQFVGLERIEAAAHDLREGRAGTLRVAVLPAFSTGFLPRVVGSLLAQRPELEIALYGSISSQVADWVASGFCELGFAQLPLDFPGIEFERLPVLPAVAVVPSDHALAARGVLTPEDFSNQPFVSLEQSTQLRYRIDSLFLAKGIARNTRIETPLSMIACALVSAGAGLALVDPYTAAEFRGRGVAVRPFEPHILFDIALVWGKGHSRSALADELAGRVRAATANLAARHPDGVF